MRTTLALLISLIPAPMAFAQEPAMPLNPEWEYVADTVMGGVSTGQIATQTIDGKQATRLTGDVSLDNNGGFVQMAFDLPAENDLFDASGYTGIEITLRGNNELYDLRLRTDQLQRPWHSFRTDVIATPQWQTLRIPFTDFEPHRTEVALDTSRLKRFGIVAIGREFKADVAVADIGFY